MHFSTNESQHNKTEKQEKEPCLQIKLINFLKVGGMAANMEIDVGGAY